VCSWPRRFAQAVRSEFRGQLLCDDRGTVVPLGGATVQLWRRGSPDFLPVESPACQVTITL